MVSVVHLIHAYTVLSAGPSWQCWWNECAATGRGKQMHAPA